MSATPAPARPATPADAAAAAPRVSVLMPARDAAGFIGDSARSVLAEAGVALELVVVDDGSTDGTAAVLAGIDDPRLRVVPGPRRGISAALNAAAAAARGSFLARCDADDFFPAGGRLGPQLGLLDARPDAVAVAGGYASMDARGRDLAVMDTGAAEADLTEELRGGRTRTHLGTWLIRRSAWEAVGGARSWFESAEDLDLQCRLAGEGRVLYRPGVAYRYRLHDASITHRLVSARRTFFDEAVTRFASQRAAGGPDDLERGRPPEPPGESTHAGGPGPAAPGHARSLSARQQAQGHLMAAAGRATAEGRRVEALRLLGRAFAADPAAIRRWHHLGQQAASALMRPTGGRGSAR
ncbi:glycosyltransferase family 2 protein [Phycisphaera mikurensis]|uniref:Putative glycosyltransferase n=1 Tax=Phycisphaera mikurensis (strain NBRC 102666 / KCTC 22515 / FYK2301M01) TaxID=1142394 RepID=I0IAY9_PHYMF|nr:glycosyltransferase family A protein [Phycisphaera mikurensis]MBB6442601.1 hypothetical protein [Phycisphaera mikurensis]BAM02427.1 putative glycosyltransferase [Phycisphaera mikurensis NBRC 102666]